MEDLRSRFEALLKKLNTDEQRRYLRELEAQSLHSDFWKDSEKAGKVMQEISDLQKELGELEELGKLVEEGKDQEALPLLEKLELKIYLSGPYDRGDAVLSIHSGQGGTEAQDWVAMLARMYQRFAEKRNWKVIILDQSPGEEAGYKEIVFQVLGPYAFGYLKKEAGVHRLVRTSPFNAQNLRQTSFALVEVIPFIEKEHPQLDLKDEDLEVQTYRASGHGGQNVQKVETAVRIKHWPTGMVVTSQAERYQARNKEIALNLLKSKLISLEEERERGRQAELKGKYLTPGWGNQIRSYVLHPYKQVKDLRTGIESTNPDEVLDGELDKFIEAELKSL